MSPMTEEQKIVTTWHEESRPSSACFLMIENLKTEEQDPYPPIPHKQEGGGVCGLFQSLPLVDARHTFGPPDSAAWPVMGKRA